MGVPVLAVPACDCRIGCEDRICSSLALEVQEDKMVAPADRAVGEWAAAEAR